MELRDRKWTALTLDLDEKLGKSLDSLTGAGAFFFFSSTFSATASGDPKDFFLSFLAFFLPWI